MWTKDPGEMVYETPKTWYHLPNNPTEMNVACTFFGVVCNTISSANAEKKRRLFASHFPDTTINIQMYSSSIKHLIICSKFSTISSPPLHWNINPLLQTFVRRMRCTNCICSDVYCLPSWQLTAVQHKKWLFILFRVYSQISTMENPPFEDVFTCWKWGFSNVMLVFKDDCVSFWQLTIDK